MTAQSKGYANEVGSFDLFVKDWGLVWMRVSFQLALTDFIINGSIIIMLVYTTYLPIM